MDALASLLNGPRAHAPFLLRMTMAEPWKVRVEDESPLTVVAVSRGLVLVRYDDGVTHHVRPGTIAIFRGTDPYDISDGHSGSLTALIDRNGDCLDPTGTHSVAEQMSRGVRSWGNVGDAGADAVLLIGTYQLGEIGRGLLSALERITLVDADNDALLTMLERELTRTAPAQEVVLSRLLDLILVTTLRTHLDAPDSAAPKPYRALSDPVVGPALALLHNNIDQGWTVESLAAEVGVSRANLARRFSNLTDAPPMTYLTDWRLAVTADLLTGTDLTVAAIAERVGYASAFALSTAFKRRRGITPTAYRRMID